VPDFAWGCFDLGGGLFGFSLREGFLIKKRSAVVLLVALGVVAC
jgi:hypothetical protein